MGSRVLTSYMEAVRRQSSAGMNWIYFPGRGERGFDFLVPADFYGWTWRAYFEFWELFDESILIILK